jgi:glycosyltransferase involved in cell wall biosynthesis
MIGTDTRVSPQTSAPMRTSRILIAQFSGDYRSAYHRLQGHRGELYFGHRYILDQTTSLGNLYGDSAILCCNSPHRYTERLPTGLVVMGAGADPRRHADVIRGFLREYDPTHLVVLGPLTSILRWGVSAGCRTIGVFADSFETSVFLRLYRYGRLTPLLNSSGIEYVANHGVNASRSLARIGVRRDKIIPWDYPHYRRPSDRAPRGGIVPDDRTLIFVGALTPAKGAGDVIRALAYLRAQGVYCRLQIVGEGDRNPFAKLANRLRVSSMVDFLGAVPNERVVELMRAAAAVIIPSRREYPEGMPLTIYEALCSRTPIVASDHPMFQGHLRDRQTAIIFPAGNARAMAVRIRELFSDPLLYASISSVAQKTWDELQIPIKWGELLHRWVRGDSSDRRWLSQHSLAQGQWVSESHA